MSRKLEIVLLAALVSTLFYLLLIWQDPGESQNPNRIVGLPHPTTLMGTVHNVRGP